MTAATLAADVIVRSFLDGSLPKPAWTHEAHLTVGLHLARTHAPAAALAAMQDGLRALNAAHGTIDSDTGGYHETITRFYMHVASTVVARGEAAGPLDDAAARFIAAWGDRVLPLGFWHRGTLFSVAARRGWVPPDVRPLDPLPRSQRHLGDPDA
ncbi:MAG: hypothetical protein NW201_10820 [Gemmatimonadales bacterium]|nr:hypothetical protein [Gemmatimonadales bacterium]